MFGQGFSNYQAHLKEEAKCDTLLWLTLGEAFEVEELMFWKVKTEMAMSEVC